MESKTSGNQVRGNINAAPRSASETNQEVRRDRPMCRGTHLPSAQSSTQTPKIAPPQSVFSIT